MLIYYGRALDIIFIICFPDKFRDYILFCRFRKAPEIYFSLVYLENVPTALNKEDS